MSFNLLSQPLIEAKPSGFLTLPGVLAALARDEVDSFPALRPHQAPAWHMFLVQLAALALHEPSETELPQAEAAWAERLRALTPVFPDDEPWSLVVDDWSKPAFMQPPVPKSVKLENPVATADGLDLLITSKNHDLKQAIAQNGVPQDWLFALISLQTGEGYGGAGNNGIARMNGGSSSRPMLGLAPLPKGGKIMTPRAGAHFARDVRVLLETRERELERLSNLEYPPRGGLGLTWLAPWPEGEQLHLKDLDIWFIEVCRRVRLRIEGECLSAVRGTSKATRIAAKQQNGAVGDPWAPVHATENKSLTLGGGDFDYRMLVRLLIGDGDTREWVLPLLALPATFETGNETMALMAAALARGNSKTEGFKSRILPIGGRIARALGPRRKALHELAQAQMEEISVFDKALAGALALVAAGGDREKRKKDHYAFAHDAQCQLNRTVDEMFFAHLWTRFEARETAEALEEEKQCFRRELWGAMQGIFTAALPSIPCPALFRPRAEVRARDALNWAIRKNYPDLFVASESKEANDAA